MELKFLSDEWFDKVDALVKEAGDIEIPVALHGLVVNITVTDSDFGAREMCLNAGIIERGHHDNAPTRIILSATLAQRIFIKNDSSASMEGFMSGQIKVEGDMSRLMIMQSALPSDDQVTLQKKILDFTVA